MSASAGGRRRDAFLSRQPPATALTAYGPVPGGRTAREAVRRLNDWYRLRDCPQPQVMAFADQPELFPVLRSPACIRHEIGRCLAPCAAICTLPDYTAAVRGVQAFLEGADRAPLRKLERAMAAASAALQFEQAAALRDHWQALHWLSRHLDRLREAARHSFVYPLAGHDGVERWYLIRQGRVLAALPKPLHAEEHAAAAAMIARVFASRRVMPGPLSLTETDGVLLVAGWFRRNADEHRRARSTPRRPWPPASFDSRCRASPA